jgi:hypothetical protein
MGTYYQDLAQLQAETPAPATRSWRLEFDCQGVPFVWTGQACTERQAVNLARGAMYRQGDIDQDAAQLVLCLEVRA